MGIHQSESLEEIIHKKKEAKKKQKAKGLLPIAYRTKGLGYHTSQEPIEQGSIDQPDKSQKDTNRTRTQIINSEIDECLESLLREEMIDPQYVPYYAKACHVLGLAQINQLKINAYNGNSPKKLFAYKVKGALTLHFKREYINS